jgi:hypothetical protein
VDGGPAVTRRGGALVARAALVLGVALAFTACGVAVSGRIDVGTEAGRPPAATPCPGAVE